MMASSSSSARHDYGVITVVGFAHGISHFFHLLLPALYPWLMPEFDLSFARIGMTMTAFFVVSGVGQVLAGFAVDRFGARQVLMGGVALLALAAAVLAIADDFTALLVVAVLAGVGNAVFHPADFTILNRHVAQSRLGYAFSAHGLSGYLGWALAPVLLTTLATLAGWRVAALGAAGFAVLSMICLQLTRRWLPDLPATPDNPEPRTPSLAFLKVSQVWLCFAFFFLTTMAFGAFQGYGVPLLQSWYGLSLSLAATGLTAFLMGGAGGVLVGGVLASRSDAHDRLVAVFLIAAAALAGVLALGVVPAWLVVPAMAVIGFCNGVAAPSRDILVRRAAASRFGAAAYGRIYGLVYSGLDAGLAVSPLVFGPLMDAGAFAAVLAVVALLQLGAVVAAVVAARTTAPVAVAAQG
jgi:predicted MFS family arabinose efflux permease